MIQQKEVWQKEHEEMGTYTRVHSEKPSGPVPSFIERLKAAGFIPGETTILDLGCGKGRNSLYSAEQGFNVVSADFISSALRQTGQRAKDRSLETGLVNADLNDGLPLAGESVHVIIDCNTTICLEKEGREKVLAASKDVLKKGGYYLFYGIAASSVDTARPGPEENSAIIKNTGQFEKRYTKEELLHAFETFETVELDLMSGSDNISGKDTTYDMWVGIFKKK